MQLSIKKVSNELREKATRATCRSLSGLYNHPVLAHDYTCAFGTADLITYDHDLNAICVSNLTVTILDDETTRIMPDELPTVEEHRMLSLIGEDFILCGHKRVDDYTTIVVGQTALLITSDSRAILRHIDDVTTITEDDKAKMVDIERQIIADVRAMGEKMDDIAEQEVATSHGFKRGWCDSVNNAIVG